MISLMLLVGATDPVPADKNVTAGWAAFAVFIGMALAVAVLGFSLVRHLRKARDNADKGVFDTEG